MTISMTLAETVFVSRTLPAKTPAVKQTNTPNRLVALLIAAVTALAMLTASAVPAQADRNDDTLKAIAAIAAIALIAKAVKDNKRGNDHSNPRPGQVRRVPAVCAIEIGSGRGSVVGYAERCLREEGFNYRLPTGCATNIRIYGRTDKFYPEQCLRNAGFKTRSR